MLPALTEEGREGLAVVLDWSCALDARMEALERLSHLGDEGAFDPLLALLDDDPFAGIASDQDDAALLYRAIGEALGRLGESRIADLCAALPDHPEPIASAMGLLLGRRTDRFEELVDALVDRLEGRDWDLLREYCAIFDALAEAGEAASRAIPVAIDALAVEILEESAGHLLWRIGPLAIPALIGCLESLAPVEASYSDPEWSSDEPRYRAVDVLVALGAPAVPPLLAALSDGHPERRYFASCALCKVATEGEEDAIAALSVDLEPLLSALSDDDEPWGAAFWAARALGQAGDSRALPALLALAGAESETGDSVREAIAAIRQRCGSNG